jgi:hypothetical protein
VLAQLLRAIERIRLHPEIQADVARIFYGDNEIARRIANHSSPSKRWQVFDPLAITGLLSFVIQEGDEERTEWSETDDRPLFAQIGSRIDIGTWGSNPRKTH